MMKRWIGALLAALLCAGCCCASVAEGELLSPKAFAGRMVDVLAEAQPDARIEQVSDMELNLYLPDNDEPYRLGLQNSYDTYRADPASLDAVLAHYRDAFLETIQGTAMDAADLQKLLPVVRHKSYLDGWNAEMLEKSAFEEWTDSLIIVYIWDLPSTVRVAQRDELAGLGVSFDALRELACQNLRGLAAGVSFPWTGEATYMLQLDGMYESSCLLLPELWNRENFPTIQGDILVAVPKRDEVLIIGSEDLTMRGMIKLYLKDQYDKMPYPVLNGFLRWNGEDFEEFE